MLLGSNPYVGNVVCEELQGMHEIEDLRIKDDAKAMMRSINLVTVSKSAEGWTKIKMSTSQYRSGVLAIDGSSRD
eukprot:5790058-Amphidinium_carterae.3